jgi:VanZ family protein
MVFHIVSAKIPERQKIQKILCRLPAPFIAACIWFLSSQPVLPRIKGIFGFDKFQHLLAYAVLAVAVGLWASPAFWKRRPFAILLFTALVSSVYGVIDEVHQYFVPGRNCNIWDWIADTLGAFFGALGMMIFLTQLWRRFKEKAENKAA